MHGWPSELFSSRGRDSTHGLHYHGHGYSETGQTAGANMMSMSGAYIACRGPGPQPLTDNGKAGRQLTNRSKSRMPALLLLQC